MTHAPDAARASAPTPPCPPLRPHLALRYAIIRRSLGQDAADAYAASVSTPSDAPLSSR